MLREFNQIKRELLEQEFSRMNNKQREAVFHAGGPLLILAGAGSGKTTTIVNRIAYLIKYGSAYQDFDRLPDGFGDDDLLLMKVARQCGEGISEDVYPLICKQPVPEYRILAFTFTNKAAGEMKERIMKMVGQSAESMWIGTFHSMCLRILRRDIERLGYSSNFGIYDTADQKTLIKECMTSLNVNPKFLSVYDVMNTISRAKDQLMPPDIFAERASDERTATIARIYAVYQSRLRQNNAVDFDDIIRLSVQLLKENPDVLEYYTKRFLHVIVDEYQDTNMAQYELISMLASGYKNLCVVGDDDQSIYGWRGADIKNIIEFEKEYQNCTVIKLEQNYRSTQRILDVANHVIKNNTVRKHKKLWTENPEGDKIQFFCGESEREEADYIAAAVEQEVQSGSASYRDFAVLYRTHAQSRAIEEGLMRAGVPYKIVSGTKFYDRMEVKDVLAYLKAIDNPSDSIAVSRILNVPKRGIGKTTLERISSLAEAERLSVLEVIQQAGEFDDLVRSQQKLLEFAALIERYKRESEQKPVSEFITYLVDDLHLHEHYAKEGEIEALTRMENIGQLVAVAKELEQKEEEFHLEEFLAHISLITGLDTEDEAEDGITLMTMHSAKGLEFDDVFVVGLEEGLFPKIREGDGDEELEEERRLCYVSFTRARKKLFLTCARTRRSYSGYPMRTMTSSFISELPTDLLEGLENLYRVKKEPVWQQAEKTDFSKYIPGKLKRSSIQSAAVSADSFAEGGRVQHKKFGVGTIAQVQKSGDMIVLTVDFDAFGRKNIISSVVTPVS